MNKKSTRYLGLSLALATTLFSCNVTRNAMKNNNKDIYILMGQSNMSGRGYLTPENQALGNPKVQVFTEDLSWKEAHNPLHFDKPKAVGVGPGLSFGMAMADANSKVEIGLVPTAVGGTSINSWVPGAKDKSTGKYPYDDAEKRIKAAMKYGTIKGIIWHQGESDSNEKGVESYMPKLKALIERVRKLTGNENLPFVAGQLGQFSEYYTAFNKMILSLPAEVPHTALVNTEGLVDRGDKTHFEANSAIKLGQRYAEKMLELQKTEK
ncbi:hypothetical protein ABIB40_002510 [Pedobacter sp. UYP30]|uniref:sialate O-acetylesterase n=1 Tax=Pedobacter sp. UYP30 TaxID=1756400 RepID=UPI00339B729A